MVAFRWREMWLGVQVMTGQVEMPPEPVELYNGMTYEEVAAILGPGRPIPGQPEGDTLYEWSHEGARLFVLFVRNSLAVVKVAEAPCELPCVVA